MAIPPGERTYFRDIDDLQFDPDCNEIQKQMSIAIIKVFSSKNWAMDTGRSAAIREILNKHLKFPEVNGNPFGKNLVFDPDASII